MAANGISAFIFGDRPGHLPDTPANRQRLVDVANDRDNYRGVDKYGNKWFVEDAIRPCYRFGLRKVKKPGPVFAYSFGELGIVLHLCDSQGQHLLDAPVVRIAPDPF